MNNIPINFIWSFALLALAIVCVIFYYGIGRKKRSVSFIKFIENNLMETVIIIMISGFFFYLWGYWEDYDAENWKHNNTGNLIVIVSKALVSALGMFVSTSDIVDLKSELRHNVFFMTPFTLVHLSAVFISIMVVLKVLGYKFSSFIKMHFSRPSAKTHIFWRINENSLMLAESIKKKEKDATIVFVELPGIDKYDYNPLVGLFNKHSIQRSYICRMEDIDAYLVKTQYTLQDINDKDTKKGSSNNIYTVLRLDTFNSFVQRSIKPSTFKDTNDKDEKKDTSKILFYFLSDSEKENMNDLMDVIKFYDGANNIPVHKIYCHARYNSTNSIITRGTQKICFADSSKLSVLQLLKQAEHQPVNFVDVDTTQAIVTSEFNALVIGFGETGRDAFKFLYEFSAFLGPNSEIASRTINVVDSNLSLLKPKFLNSCPALSVKKDISWWNDMSVDSQDFWNKYLELIDKLNYIVITFDNDKTASDLAVKMYQTAYRYRKDLNHFKIFVRLKDFDAAQLFNHIAEYYKVNSNREDNGTHSLVSFGTYRTLFDVDIFDTDIEDQDSEAFSNQYYEIFRHISELLKEEPAPVPTLLAKDIKSMTYHQQDISNVRHVDTKLVLAGAVKWGKDCETNCDVRKMAELRRMSERKGFEYPNAPEGSPEFTLMENLSLCEHLRWNSKLEVLGFVNSKLNSKVKYPEKNFDFKTHECLVLCHELNAIPKFKNTKIYDWAVVELSFRYRLSKAEEPGRQ